MNKVEKEPFMGILALPAFPVVLVTVAENVMTAAAFHFYSFNPPHVMVGIRPQTLTYQLILEYQEFGINIPTTELLDSVRICGSVSGRVEDKFKKTGLTPIKGREIRSVIVGECPVNLECRVVHEVQFEGSHHWFVGEIVAAYVEEHYSRDHALMFWLRQYREVGKVIFEIEN
jgi:flavin reductase (DIM6/NTAB) family NADH-FMN oxidoreductase RutF